MRSRFDWTPGTLRRAGTLAAALAVGGAWWSATRAERRIRDDNDAVMARFAAAYIALITPAAPDGSRDPALLISAAHTIADASFWPGGFQMAIGNVALIADTIGLVPLPDSVRLRLVEGAGSVTTGHGRHRVTVVSVAPARTGGPETWAAAWDTLPSRLPFRLFAFFTLGMVAGLIGFGASRRGGRRRDQSALALLALFSLLAALGLGVRRTARAATVSRLLMARQLVEIAATASGVEQADLPLKLPGLETRESPAPPAPRAGVRWERGVSAPRASVVATTPRTRRGLELRLVPVEASLAGYHLILLSWFGVGLVGAWLHARSAGLSVGGGLFHTLGSGRVPPSEQGRIPG